MRWRTGYRPVALGETGWDTLRRAVVTKRLPVLEIIEGAFSPQPRWNTIVGGGHREYDLAALGGVHEAVDWWRDLDNHGDGWVSTRQVWLS